MTAIAQHFKRLRSARGIELRSESVLTVVMDDHSVHCMTESMLDVWWTSLEPEQKAEIYETNLDSFPAPLIVHELAEQVNSFEEGWAAINSQPIDVLRKPVQL